MFRRKSVTAIVLLGAICLPALACDLSLFPDVPRTATPTRPTATITPTPAPALAVTATPIPSPTPVSSATPTRIPTLAVVPTRPALQIGDWKSLPAKICLSVIHDISALRTGVPDPMAEAAYFIVDGLGLGVDYSNPTCDAWLTVHAAAGALTANYYFGTGSTRNLAFCYSGAEIQLDASLTRAGSSSRRARQYEKHEPPATVAVCAKTAAEAPYAAVWNKALLLALKEIFGTPALVTALSHPPAGEQDVSAAAAELLQGEALPGLLPWLMPRIAAGDGSATLFTARQYREKAAFITPYAAEALVKHNPGAPTAELDALIKALGLVGPAARDAVPVLINKLASPYFLSTRTVTAEALGKIGPGAAQAAPVLLKILANEQDETLRYTSVIALGNMGAAARAAVPALKDACRSGTTYVRTYAIIALGQIGPDARPAVPDLIAALTSSNEFDASSAARSLAQISGQDFGLDAQAWQAWWDGQPAR